jgi:5'-3' exoribonuclease 1
MGIPSYFSYIVKSHRQILKKYKNEKINNLYLDCNSIIYDSTRSIIYEGNNIDYEIKLLNQVCKMVESYIKQLNPTDTIFIAFDGVAPIAKLDQQRNRRYKSNYQNKILEKIKQECGKNIESKWDTTAITPGTTFMKNLCKKIKAYFKSSKAFNVSNIIVSAGDKPGEGEHKIYQYIRENPKKHKDSVTVIYGLDADLIMLTLNHLRFCKNMYLYRETPEFIKSIDRTLNPNTSYLMDIRELSKEIINELSGEEEYKENSEEIDVNRLYDYIFICFFLGNDFLPHFPALSLRTNGMNYLIAAYKHIIGNNESKAYLTDGHNIHWKNLRKYIAYLAKNEHEYLLEEYKIREKWEKRRLRNDLTPEAAKEEYFMSMPTKERDVERYINPKNRYWEHRYYKSLFNMNIDEERSQQICTNFLEGIEWTMKYYTIGCVDWRWSYKYDYPPLLTDLIKYIPYFEIEFVPSLLKNPVHPYIQLAYVLPLDSLHLLPKKMHTRLLEKFGEKYGYNFDFKWSFCKYFWETHVELPEYDIKELEAEINVK